ncbi:phosphotransferase family protein [Dictyobacter formicarum]|uniref:6'-aminoglycoside N-acetyltransferase n=1 Tax=Dictyobacter formicarum TaxID=2778368 RepID=A0ABQ3VGJ2_9CHLR|nr:aminoglycoside phosphotransferase family protein [Dictyobacter formicarum]GHO85280.1 6'-aminoglycoside N-acetyltransferase [Dictyobacter formicarum]
MEVKDQYLRHICRSYPELSVDNMKFVQHGQNNDVLIVNDEFIFRFPKYRAGLRQLEIEVALLRFLRNIIMLPIPQILFDNLSAQTIGEAFVGYRMLAGQPFWRQTFLAITDEETLDRLARQLALFLQQLHSIPVSTLPADALPLFNTYAECLDIYTRMHERCFPFMRAKARKQVSDHFERFLAESDNFSFAPVLKHGDFGDSNILYSAEQRSISGVIDFGGMGLGDPAYDFAGLLSCYGEPFVRRCITVYPEVAQFWGRITFYQGTFALLEALFGLENNDQQAFESGIAAYR